MELSFAGLVAYFTVEGKFLHRMREKILGTSNFTTLPKMRRNNYLAND